VASWCLLAFSVVGVTVANEEESGHNSSLAHPPVGGGGGATPLRFVDLKTKVFLTKRPSGAALQINFEDFGGTFVIKRKVAV